MIVFVDGPLADDRAVGVDVAPGRRDLQPHVRRVDATASDRHRDAELSDDVPSDGAVIAGAAGHREDLAIGVLVALRGRTLESQVLLRREAGPNCCLSHRAAVSVIAPRWSIDEDEARACA